MHTEKPLRESLSFKQNEKYLLDSRDTLCKYYNLNKSDLVKYLIKKESFNLKNPKGTLLWLQRKSSPMSTILWQKASSSRYWENHMSLPKTCRGYSTYLFRSLTRAIEAKQSDHKSKAGHFFNCTTTHLDTQENKISKYLKLIPAGWFTQVSSRPIGTIAFTSRTQYT